MGLALEQYAEKHGKKLDKAPARRVATVAVMHGPHLLMGKRRDNGKWTTPGGHADEGEDLHSAAARELEEESGIKAEHHELHPLAEPKTVTNDKGEKVQVQPFSHHVDDRPDTSMKQDPDAEVHRWTWIDTSRGLPDHIKKNLHVPADRNCLLQSLGLHEEKDVKKCGALSKYMQSKGMKAIQTGHDEPLEDGDIKLHNYGDKNAKGDVDDLERTEYQMDKEDGTVEKERLRREGPKSKRATKNLDKYEKMKGKK